MANHEGMGENGSFLRRFPMWQFPRRSMHEEMSTRHECHWREADLRGPIRFVNECIGDFSAH
jgi:hypothetical protein